MMDHLILESLTLHYGRTEVVHALDLAVPQGQLVSLLGPSGCGKTTTMRAVAGLLEPSAGRIVLAGADITRLSAHRRDIGLVFQSYALFPHLSAWENVAFGLRMRRVPAAEVELRVRDAIAAVGLAGFAQRLPASLSGGQQQRVAVARAIVIRPRLLLLDEPLSNLDAKLRIEMRAELRRIQRETGITMLYVTHDQEEALSLSDRVVVMREGRIEQDAPPEQVYERPATAFVAGFMGFANLLSWRDGALQPNKPPNGHDGRAWQAAAPWPMPLQPARRPGTLAWRAENVEVAAADSGAGPPGRVLARSYLGDGIELLLDTPLGALKARASAAAPWREGDAIRVVLDPARAVFI